MFTASLTTGIGGSVVSVASVAEMTGKYGLMLPIRLAAGVATLLARRLSYGTVYIRKLLHRGIGIELPAILARPGRQPSCFVPHPAGPGARNCRRLKTKEARAGGPCD